MEERSEYPAAAAAAAVEEKKKKKMRVLVAVDEGDVSMHALAWALDHVFKQAGGEVPDPMERIEKLFIVHVQQPLYYMMQPVGPAVYATSSVMDSVRKAQEQCSAQVLNRALEICKERMVGAETMIMDGDPKDMICQAAEQMHVDLLVVGSRGIGKIKRAILGSVSDYCAHHVKCPILIVKPPKEQT